MDSFIQNSFCDKLFSVERNNSDNDGRSDGVVLDSIVDDGGNDRSNSSWHLPVSAVVDKISSTNVKETLRRIGDTITAFPNADVGTTGAASVSTPTRRRLFVGVASVVSDSALAEAHGPEGFRRMEDNKKQRDRLDGNHRGTHSNNSDSNSNDRRRILSDSRLGIPKRSSKRKQQRDLRREMYDSMLVIPNKRNWKQQQPFAITNWREEEDEWHKNGTYDDNKYKQKNSIVVINNRRIPEIDRWVVNHDNNNNLRREMSDSRLVIPKRSWKQKQRDFRREMSDSMLVIANMRNWKQQQQQQLTAITNKRKEEDEDEWHKNGTTYDYKYKHKSGIVTTNKKRKHSLQNFSWNDKTNNCDTKSILFALGDLAPKISATRSGSYRKKETTSRTA